MLADVVQALIFLLVAVVSGGASPLTRLSDAAAEHLAVAPLTVLAAPTVGSGLPVAAVLPAVPTAPFPSLSARRFVLLEAATGYQVAGRNERTPHAPASLTKLMTALLAFEALPNAGTPVRISVRAATTAGKGVDLVPGESVAAGILLRALVVASGNDVAVALAEHVAGSVPAFVARMNARAELLGMRDTHFVNPTGLDAPGHMSSARDIALLARAFFASPQRAQLTRAASVTIPGPGRVHAVREFPSTNELINTADFTIVGTKTGTTDASGASFAVVATEGPFRFVAVLLKSQNRFADARRLLTWASAGQP